MDSMPWSRSRYQMTKYEHVFTLVKVLVIASSGSKLFFLGGQTILAPYDLDMPLIKKSKINTTFIAELVKVIFRIKG